MDMRRFFTLSLMALASTCVTARGGVINFSDQSLSPNSYINGGPSTNSFGFHSGGAYLNNNYSSDYGGYWNGWSLSNVNNTGTDYPAVPDFGGNHLYAAYPGGGVGGTSSVYAVGDWDGFDPMYIDLPAGQRPTSVESDQYHRRCVVHAIRRSLREAVWSHRLVLCHAYRLHWTGSDRNNHGFHRLLSRAER